MEEETVFNPLQFVFSLDTLRIILAYDFFVNRRFACVNATRGTGAALQKKYVSADLCIVLIRKMV